MQTIPINEDFAQELLHPDWQLVENHFGVAMPECLKAFYADPEKVLVGDFDLETPKEVDGGHRIQVLTFTPINAHSTEAFEGFGRFLEIASDGGEGLYFFDPKEAGQEVYLFVMDGGDLFPTGLSLPQFLEAPRLEPDDFLPE